MKLFPSGAAAEAPAPLPLLKGSGSIEALLDCIQPGYSSTPLPLLKGSGSIEAVPYRNASGVDFGLTTPEREWLH